MNSEILQQMQSRFDSLAKTLPDDNVEFWFARDLQEALGYIRWENFLTATQRDIGSCETVGYISGQLTMLCTKQMFVVVISIFLVIISIWILYRLIKSYISNNELQKRRKFYIAIPVRVDKLPGELHIDDESYDWAVNLEISHSKSILAVDVPVDIVGTTTSIPENFFPNLRVIKVEFPNSRAYPISFDDRGIIKRESLYMNKTQDNRLVGTAKLFWQLEGQYVPIFHWEYIDGSQFQLPIPVNSNAMINVYPKSEITQIENNLAIIDLAFAAYVVGVVGALNIIFQLMGWI